MDFPAGMHAGSTNALHDNGRRTERATRATYDRTPLTMRNIHKSEMDATYDHEESSCVDP